MSIGKDVVAFASSQTGKAIDVAIVSATLAWIAGWWKMRDRYRAFVTWQTTETVHGPEEQPVIVIHHQAHGVHAALVIGGHAEECGGAELVVELALGASCLHWS